MMMWQRQGDGYAAGLAVIWEPGFYQKILKRVEQTKKR
jgi:hypothetical protein